LIDPRSGSSRAPWRSFVPWLPFIALAFALVAWLGVDVPREDDWFLPHLLADGGFNLYNVFAPANEHRIALSRLISLGIALAAGWNVKLYMFVNVALATATFLLIVRMAWREVPRDGRGFLFHFANLLCCALVLSVAQHDAMLFGALMPFYLVNLLAVGAIALLTAPSATGRRARALGAALLATLASFSAAQGLLAWPALAPLLARPGRSSRWPALVAWIGAGAAVAFLYLADLSSAPVSEAKQTLAFAAAGVPAAILALLGAPWAAHALGAPIAGAALVLVLAAILARSQRVHLANGAPWLALAAFSALATLAIALGRTQMDPGVGLTGRYLPVTSLFSVAVVQLLRARAHAFASRSRHLGCAAAGALLAVLVLRAVGTLDVAVAHARLQRQLALCLALAHQAPRGCLVHVHPDYRRLMRDVALVESRGVRRFEPPLPTVDDPRQRAGYIDVPADGSGPVRMFRGRHDATAVLVRGWAAVPGRAQPAPIVFFTYNDEHRFFASALVDGARPDVARALGQRADRNAGWEARIPASLLPSGPGTVHAWAWDQKGRRFLRLGGEVRVVVLE